MPKGQKKQKQDLISQRQFEELCHIQCTRDEICSVLGVDDETMSSWCLRTYGKKFSTVFKEKREGGCCSLRRAQWKKGVELLDTTMLVWLGKNFLGQTDKVENSITGGEIKIISNIPTIKDE